MVVALSSILDRVPRGRTRDGKEIDNERRKEKLGTGRLQNLMSQASKFINGTFYTPQMGKQKTNQ